ncbi:MAG: heavy metal-binding domain-containing protein [Armatimonadota bacterium]
MLIACLFAITVLSILSSAQQKKQSVVQGEVVCLTCYIAHGSKGAAHAKCAAACINKGLPMGILTKDGKLFVALEDHANADAYQQLKKFAAKIVTVTGVVASRSGITGIAVQKVSGVEAAKTPSAKSTKVQYVCPMGCIPPQDKPGNCPKCGMKLVKKE